MPPDKGGTRVGRKKAGNGKDAKAAKSSKAPKGKVRGNGSSPGMTVGAAPMLLPILSKTGEHPCHNCAKCCTYVALEHETPRTMKDYDHIIWYLYHQGVSVFVDWENSWYVKFEARCDNLNAQGMCDVYDHRPAICKDFDWRECENHLTPDDGAPDKYVWNTGEEFLEWFEEKRPKTFKRYQRFMKKRHAKGEEKELLRVAEEDGAASAAN